MVEDGYPFSAAVIEGVGYYWLRSHATAPLNDYSTERDNVDCSSVKTPPTLSAAAIKLPPKYLSIVMGKLVTVSFIIMSFWRRS